MCFHNILFHCIFIESEVTIYDFLVTLVEFFAIYSDCWTVAKSAPDTVCWSKCTFFVMCFVAGCLDRSWWRWSHHTRGRLSRGDPDNGRRWVPFFVTNCNLGWGGADSPAVCNSAYCINPMHLSDNLITVIIIHEMKSTIGTSVHLAANLPRRIGSHHLDMGTSWNVLWKLILVFFTRIM